MPPLPTPVLNPTQPYWLKAFPGASKPAPPRPASASNGARRPSLPPVADVVIIGGGISGVSAAYHLRKLRPDLQVVLLEARQLSHGATGRNGGLLWPALNAPWCRTVARYGASETGRMMAFEQRCLAELVGCIRGAGLAEEVRWAPFSEGGLHVCESEEEMELQLRELRTMQEFGFLTDAHPLSRRQTSALLGCDTYRGGAVRQPGVSRVWAARLVAALARLAAAEGG
ncbi:hypothetical protein Agub_g11099, partial [Astrephomene gubernaculifera]